MQFYEFQQGDSAFIVSVPHVGTYVPDAISAHMTDAGLSVIDTDWHVEKLYDFLAGTDATLLIATHARYVVDLNRDPDGGMLYPGRFETGVCPDTTFAGEPLYRDGKPVPSDAIAARVETYWRPYHDKLVEAIARAKARHGYALVLDAHSIISHMPALFEGTLPDLNLGTADGQSCAPAIADAAMACFAAQERLSHVLNGRFKGGYITRHYGDPQNNVHAVQLEMAMRAYLDEAHPQQFDRARARNLRDLLKGFVSSIRTAAAL